MLIIYAKQKLPNQESLEVPEGLSGTVLGSSRLLLQGGETLALGVLPARYKSKNTGRERKQEEPAPSHGKGRFRYPAVPRAG